MLAGYNLFSPTHELSSPGKINFVQFKVYENDLAQKFQSWNFSFKQKAIMVLLDLSEHLPYSLIFEGNIFKIY